MIAIHYFYFSSVDDQDFLIILWSLNHTPWTSSCTGYCEPRGPSVAMRTYAERRHAIVNARVTAIFGRNQPSRALRGSPTHVGAAPANADASAAPSVRRPAVNCGVAQTTAPICGEQRAPRQSLTPVPLKGTSTGIELLLDLDDLGHAES